MIEKPENLLKNASQEVDGFLQQTAEQDAT